MILNIYSVAFFISIFLLALLVVVGGRQSIAYFVLIFASITVNILGYYIVSTASELDVALVGQQFIHLTYMFIPVLILFGVMKFCNMEIHRWLGLPLVFLTVFILYCTFTVGKDNYYYKNVQLVTKNGLSYLEKEYGPAHTLWLIIMFGCVVATFFVIVYSVVKKKDVSYNTAFLLFLAEAMVVACYMFRRLTGSHIEWFVVAYIFDEFIILSIIRKFGMYTVSESVADSLDENTTYGYIVFDKKRRYTVCNEVAKKYFPEIKEQKVDTMLTPETTPLLYNHFSKCFNKNEGSEYKCTIENNGYLLKCSFKDLQHAKDKRKRGYLIEILDDTQQQKYLKLLNEYSSDLEHEVREQTKHINIMHERMILNIADMVENRDTSTGGHIKRTSDVIGIFANELKKVAREYGFTEDFLKDVVRAAPMHDLGKIVIDDRILRKPGKFEEWEYEEMKKHAEKGVEIITQVLDGVEDTEFVEIAKNIAHYHHEKWDGTGYPLGLAGIGIPLEARIMALADVFDVLVSKRCYKDELSYDEAFKIIESDLGSHFDPELGKMFLLCRDTLEKYYDEMR